MNGQNPLRAAGVGLALVFSLAGSGTASAIPITYQIGAGSAPGFSGSWLHNAHEGMGNSGYFANGDAIRMTGELTVDLETGMASGRLAGSGDFGLNNSAATEDWLLVIRGGSKGTQTFKDGEKDILTLSYMLTSSGGHEEDGYFYFADRDFNGDTREDGPNYIDQNRIYLWGNNWVNKNGAKDRERFVYEENGEALGLDLYGTAPEPGLLALMATGLMGIGFSARLRRHNNKS